MPNLTLFRATHSSGDQAFHDRILILNSSDGPSTAFALTNSFSGMAQNYPLVVAELPAGTTAAVLDDLETLLAASADGSLKLQELWTRVSPTRRTRLEPVRDWRWVIDRLIPRRRSKAARLQRAVAEGYFTVDGSSDPVWAARDGIRAARILDRLLPLPAKRRSSRLDKRAVARRHSLGRAVAAIGEMVARGLPVTADDVAARLAAADGQVLERFLRRGSKLLADPRIPTAGVSQKVWMVRQGLARTEAALE